MDPIVRWLLALAVVGLLLDAAGAVLLVVCWARLRRRYDERMRATAEALRAALRLAIAARSTRRTAPRS